MNLFNTRLTRTFMSALLIAATAFALVRLGRRRPMLAPGDVPAYRQKGPRSAPVTIVIYSDFECPFCRRGAKAVDGLFRHYPNRLHIVFRQKPLTNMHPYAMLAARTAECAGQQGKFWEFHDSLFAHQDDWAHPPDTAGRLTALARQTGLDVAKLGACMSSPATSALIEADLRDAAARNVHATPTFLIDDQRYVGDRQLLTTGLPEIKKRLRP